LDAVAAAAHADAALGFLLRALDVRQRPPAALAAAAAPAAGFEALEVERRASGVAAVEAAAVGALEQLVMKLSEARFRPLFQRLLAWAAAPPAADPGARPASGCARLC
jgi:U3 small nucleolar RNA-associated protein 10